MKNSDSKRFLLWGGLLGAVLTANAIEPPVMKTQTLTDGGKYILFNKATPSGYMSRTGWDGALYFLGESDSQYANHQFEARQNEDKTWSFVIGTETTNEDGTKDTTYSYMETIGSANVNFGSTPAVWDVEESSTDAGYYRLKAGEGNHTSSVGHLMHLNKGQQYFVISFPGDGWYPDFAIKTDENGMNVSDEASGFYHMADSTSINWAFVNVDDVPAYAARMNGYNIIIGYEETYLTTTGYEAGFQSAVETLEAIYNDAAYTAAHTDSINGIVNGKVNLFNEIEKAKVLNEKEDAILAAAIEAAMNTFNTSVSAKELGEALVTLVNAESAYSQGLGDLTSLGVNMSFEDLSAQNGQTTVGVGNPPYGWNLIINGDTCRTIEEIQNHGIANWCGVNGDCTGETKDGEYGFGIWTAGFPSVELSQTITGLENGTYEVSAALMVGANGNGSRRTTQRIFGNLNSIYFAAQTDYDATLLDNSEVYGFAGLAELVTDTEMQPITVRAYVYDGTLTLGLRTDNNVAAALRSSSNPNGGDGWFKVDNFRIAKVGYDSYDAVTVLRHYTDILDDYLYDSEALYTGTTELLENELDALEKISYDTPQEEINAAIVKAKNLLVEVAPAVEAYRNLSAAIEEAYLNLETYAEMPGAALYEETIEGIQAKYIDGLYTPEEAIAAITTLEEALEACKKSEISVGKDITYLIANPSFENQKATQPGGDTGGLADAPKGWTLTINGDTCRTVAEIKDHGIANWCAINSGDAINVTLTDGTVVTKQPTDGDKLWGIWTPTLPEVELSQTITGLPQGTYVMTADVMVQHNGRNNITTQRIFGNSFVQMFAGEGTHDLNMPADAAAAKYIDDNMPDLDYTYLTYAGYTCASEDRTTDLLHPMKVTFAVGENGVAHIGFRTNGVDPNGNTGTGGEGWFKVDNFTLFYESEALPAGIKCSELENGTATVVSSRYFTINGVETAAPQKGICIVKSMMSDGTVKVTKLLVK